MGAPPHLVLPDPSLQRPSFSSPPGSVFSPDSCATSSSLSSSDSSSSSFTQSYGDPTPNTFKQEEKPQLLKRNAVLEVNVRHRNRAKLKLVTKSSSIEPLREPKTASTTCRKRVSIRKACCRCAGAFAVDCAAVSCCPCAVISLLAFVLIEVPSAFARKMVINLQTRLCIKGAPSARSSRGGDNSHSIFTPARSHSEASEGEGEKQAVSVIRFSTQNLLEHFEAENVGFGCLSQKRE